MNRSGITVTFLFAIALAIALNVTLRAAEPATQPSEPSNPLDALVPYIGGEWRIDGAWSDGRPLKARETFEWGVGKKFIVCKTFVTTAEGEYQRYETIFGVEKGKLMAWGFVFDGHADVGEYKLDGKKLSSRKPMPASSGAQNAILHQSIELVEPNQIRWLVSIEKDGRKQQIMDGRWVRDPVKTSSTR